MYIKKKYEAKKNEDDAAAEVFDQRKDDTMARLDHLSGIVDSFQPTERTADQAKISLMDYILKGLDTLIGDVEGKLGLKG